MYTKGASYMYRDKSFILPSKIFVFFHPGKYYFLRCHV